MSRIRLDYTNAMADAVGSEHGVAEAELAGLAPRAAQALAAVQARRSADLRWLDLPHQAETCDDILSYAASVQGRFENVVVLGIGGSALGNTALHTALNSPYHNLQPPSGLPRLFVLDNIDPDLIGEFLATVDPATCVFNVISKSGTTPETAAQFLIFREKLVQLLGDVGHREHVVVTTDASKGVLREVARRDGYRTFPVPDGVGGRFSVLSPVGLVSSALVGIDVRGLLAGAAAMDEMCRSAPLLENPALVHACLQWLLHTRKGKPISVTFAYSQRLRDLGDWYAQLLAESLGKRKGRSGKDVFVGPTPVRAVGVTDQHSQVQLYVEGPFDKWFTLLCVRQPDHSLAIPHGFGDLEALSYLGGHGLVELFHAEREGTRIALREARRPNASIWLDKVDAHSLGQLVYLLELSVGGMGELYEVDAFDQPGVEAGKVAACALLGRAGYEKRRAEIAAAEIPEARRRVV